eukprot:6208805-Pleurochrysis_carterae.AAC.1
MNSIIAKILISVTATNSRQFQTAAQLLCCCQTMDPISYAVLRSRHELTDTVTLSACSIQQLRRE